MTNTKKIFLLTVPLITFLFVAKRRKHKTIPVSHQTKEPETVIIIVKPTIERYSNLENSSPSEQRKNKRAAFIVIKSAEGKRSDSRKNVSPEKLNAQRNDLERAGIRRIHPSLPH